MKKLLCTALVLLGAVHLHAQEEEIPWRKDITMLVIPRKPLAVQVAQDISRRYPTLIVCYQTTPAAPILHAWNGESWVGVSVSDYTNGTFFTHRPRHAVIVEDEGRPAPEVLIPDGLWCDSANRLASSDTRVILHLLGRYFDFPYRYWVQFSRRYSYALEELNPSLLNIPWIHYRGDRAVAAFRARDFERDMNKWSTIEITPPESVEPVALKKPIVLPPAEVPAQEMIDQPVELPVEKPAETPEAPMIEQPAKPVVEEPEVLETSKPKHVEIVVETDKPKTPEKSVSEIMIEIHNPDAEKMDPFSTNDIPAAVIITPSE